MPRPLLQDTARDVLKDWAGLEAVASTPTPAPIATPRLDLGVALRGPRPGLLALTAPLALGEVLAVEATGDPGAGEFAEAALQELARLLAEALVPAALGQSLSDYAPVAAESLAPTERPFFPERSFATLSVAGRPLELRLWFSDPAD